MFLQCAYIDFFRPECWHKMPGQSAFRQYQMLGGEFNDNELQEMNKLEVPFCLSQKVAAGWDGPQIYVLSWFEAVLLYMIAD